MSDSLHTVSLIDVYLYCKFHYHFFPFSEGSNNGIIAYYLSEFNVRESRVSEVDEAMATLDGGENGRKARRGSGRKTDDSLIIDGMTSGGKESFILLSQFQSVTSCNPTRNFNEI